MESKFFTVAYIFELGFSMLKKKRFEITITKRAAALTSLCICVLYKHLFSFACNNIHNSHAITSSVLRK